MKRRRPAFGCSAPVALLLIFGALVALLALRRSLAAPPWWLDIVLALLPLLFWLVALFGLLAGFVRGIWRWRADRRSDSALLLERACAGIWGAHRFQPLLTVLLDADALLVVIPPFIVAEAEQVRIRWRALRRVEVRRERLSTACRVLFYDSGGRVDEIVLYPRRPAQLVAALQKRGVTVWSPEAASPRALVYPLLEVCWLAVILLWLAS